MQKLINLFLVIILFLISANVAADTKDINIRANNQGATKYVAFIVGNNSYKTYTSLNGPDQDVKAIKNVFNDMGFKIINTKIQNLTKAEMEQATQSFIREIDSNTVAIFYYSGHGTSYENTNYLVPVNADFISEAVDADLNLYSADKLLKLIEQKGARTSIAIFDSCRNNLNISRDKSVSPNGFSIMASSGTQVVYATAPGVVARSATSPDSMSPFTKALIESINDSNNLNFNDVIRQASRKTKIATNSSQQPYVGGTGDFEFVLRSKQELARGQVPNSSASQNTNTSPSTSPIKSTPIQDDSIIKYNTGMAYFNEKDYKNAMEWFLKSAEKNYSRAQYMIGALLATSNYGFEYDSAKAFEWYMKAAEQNHSLAQYSIGLYYQNGYGVFVDSKKAFEWYMKAAEQGHSRAQNQIGKMYLNGDGVSKNINQARIWLKNSDEREAKMLLRQLE